MTEPGGENHRSAMTELYGGVETGGTWCVCALGADPDRIVAHEQFPTTDPESTLARIIEFFRRHPGATAVGVGSFGPVDLDPGSPTWGYVTTTPKAGWQQVPVAGVISEGLGVPVAFDTDVSAAAVGEHRWGAGLGLGSLCYLTVGTGIGGALLVDGRPWHGLVHPELGHMRIPHDRSADRFEGSCLLHGDCWEGLASGHAIAERWQLAPEELPDDHPAWELEAEYLALGIVNVVMTFSPERVIIGGGVMGRAALLAAVRLRLGELVAGYLQTPLLDDRLDAYVVTPELGDRAGALGAIAMAAAIADG